MAIKERRHDVYVVDCRLGAYSSLSALHRFPVDALKIDRSLVADLGSEEEGSEVIIRSTVAMAHSLGLPVIAEGIEVPSQPRRLRAVGCEFGQGHLFSPALSGPDMAALLGRWSPAEITALFTAVSPGAGPPGHHA